jgi:hypothetical protein
VIWILVSGLFSAAVGALFGLPSLRIKGFYLAVATLAAQFFLQWCFIRIPWLYNYNASGAIEVPTRTLFGVPITGPTASVETRYLVVLAIVVGLTWFASNLVHGRIGRLWMAVRDMDIAAELMGVNLLRTKLLAFAVSSFYAGVAGALLVFLWLGGAEAGDVFNIRQSFLILFMVIIGGLGSLIGSFMGAAFISALPTLLKFGLPALWRPDLGRHRRTPQSHGDRRAHHLLPHRRTAWPRPPVADRQAEAEGLAVPLLEGADSTGRLNGGTLFQARPAQNGRREHQGRLPPMKKTLALMGLLLGTALTAPALAQDSVNFVHNTYRTGAFSGSGIPVADGMRDYITMLNTRDGGIGGVKINLEECEMGYDTRKGVECYEQSKSKNSILYVPWSTGVTLAVIPRAHIDKIPDPLHGLRPLGCGRGSDLPLGVQPARDLLGRRRLLHRLRGQPRGRLRQAEGQDHRPPPPRRALRQGADPGARGPGKEHGFSIKLYPVPASEMQEPVLGVAQHPPRTVGPWIYLQRWGAHEPHAVT